MSKGVFRLILAAYLAFETAASFYNAFFGVRVPADIVRQLYGVFGQPVELPQWPTVAFGVISVVLFIWAMIGLFLFWPGASPGFRYSASRICGHRSSQALLHNFWLV